jgi:hypothetical protein
MMDVEPQTQRIQMIKPHRQCLRTEMLPSDHTAKDIPQMDRAAKTTPQTDRTAKETPQKGSNRAKTHLRKD